MHTCFCEAIHIFQFYYNKNVLPHSLGVQKSNIEVSAGYAPLVSSRKRSSWTLAVVSGFRHSLAALHNSNLHFHLQHFFTSLCLLSLIKTVTIEVRSHLPNPGYPLPQTLNPIALQRTPQQINSYLFKALEC